ncbi:hypothetical protein M3P21_14920 [Ruegeria sp. 2012CJ41-6]|uniref:Uncharacterized protein n=1 Tax=Ruegeria spongiae TaxID=2942209 RepID=A0ABT0Q7I0_9RHOB|nr:hypothetical protein [Ruegeria spongiae]MCL6284824.1 hypothetical protein [Ruegeria spongiae]
MSAHLDPEDTLSEPTWIRVPAKALVTGWGLFGLAQSALFWSIAYPAVSTICALRQTSPDDEETPEG